MFHLINVFLNLMHKNLNYRIISSKYKYVPEDNYDIEIKQNNLFVISA